MSSHPEPPIEPAARERSPWTSLEIAKFIASLATPFALFTLSYLLNEQQTQADRIAAENKTHEEQLEKVRQKHEDSAAAAATRAAQQLADKEAERRDKDTRFQNQVFQIQLQRVALDREKDLQDEAFRRNESVRKQQLELARFQKLAEKRIEFWEKLAPKLDQIDMILDNVFLRKVDPQEVFKLFRECENLFGLYKPYFSPKFVDDYLAYKTWAVQFIDLFSKPVVVGLVAHDGVLSGCQNYFNLRNSAAYEVAEATGLLDRASGERSYQTVFVDCEKRAADVAEKAGKLDQPSQVH